jgi:hypothetical protein
MTGDEIVALSKKHPLTEILPQGAVNPIPVARAKVDRVRRQLCRRGYLEE